MYFIVNNEMVNIDKSVVEELNIRSIIDNNYNCIGLKTNIGRLKIDDVGYLNFSSGKYHKQRLHRVLYKLYINKDIKGLVIHHNDENKLNNSLSNLTRISKSKHSTHHHKGKIYPKNGATRNKMSEARNSTGVYHVSILNRGNNYMYQYRLKDDNYAKHSTSIIKLKEKVLKDNYSFEIFDENMYNNRVKLDKKNHNGDIGYNKSKCKSSTGIKYVSVVNGSYRYNNRNFNYRVQRKSLSKLKEKVIGDNMPWIEFNKGGDL